MTNLSNSIIRKPIFGLSDIDQLISDFNQYHPLSSRNTSLNCHIKSENHATVAEIEVPGVEPSEVKVRIEGRSLSVETPKGNAYVTIGQRLDADKAEASLKYGLLTVRIPTRDAKVVEVKVHEE